MSDTTISQRFHLSLNVSDLARSVEFYRQALGTEPAKHHADYAKFELTNPPLVLSLEPAVGGQEKLNHLGIRVADASGLRPFATRIQASGMDAQYLQSVECCYSRQSKFTLTDPDGNLVEFYVLEEELDRKSPAADTAAPPQTQAAKAWEHLLGSEFPFPIPHHDGELDEVRLRGTFNRSLDQATQEKILAEAHRVLRPNGQILIHSLVADREVEGKLPQLPGPAALVEHTPVESRLLEGLENSGFHHVFCKRFSHSPVFQFGEAQMRELLVTAARPTAAGDTTQQTVVYRGPFRSITDDEGRTYRRGTRTQVSGETVNALSAAGLVEHFVVLNTPPPSQAACGARSENETGKDLHV